MNVVDYKIDPNISIDIKPLFLSAFPEDERPPAEYFFASFDKETNHLFGFYDGDEFIGFASVILYKDICYIFFLAVSPEKRNQGYGSEIVQILKELYKDYSLLLCYEEVSKKYPDYNIRKIREQFYIKNGFKKNPLKTNEFGVVFQTAVLGNRRVTFEEYKNIFLIGFGEYAAEHIFPVIDQK